MIPIIKGKRVGKQEGGRGNKGKKQSRPSAEMQLLMERM